MRNLFSSKIVIILIIAVILALLLTISGSIMNRNPLDIHYFPTSGRNNTELFTVAGDLMECLEFITLPNGDVLHGTSMSYEVQDGVLHFFVNYNLTLRRETEETAMETLETTVEPKKG